MNRYQMRADKQPWWLKLKISNSLIERGWFEKRLNQSLRSRIDEYVIKCVKDVRKGWEHASDAHFNYNWYSSAPQSMAWVRIDSGKTYRYNSYYKTEAHKHTGSKAIASTSTTFGGLKMWVLEYGSGSYMDTTNPFLKDYLQSEYYNKERVGLAIYSPRKRPYKDIDENVFEPTGSPTSKQEPHNIENVFEPVLPHHIIKEAFGKGTSYEKEFQKDIMNTFTITIASILPCHKKEGVPIGKQSDWQAKAGVK